MADVTTNLYNINGNNGTLQNTITASLLGTASFAKSASYAPGGGISLVSGSTYPITASWANTASYALNAPSIDTSSFLIRSGSNTVTDGFTLTATAGETITLTGEQVYLNASQVYINQTAAEIRLGPAETLYINTDNVVNINSGSITGSLLGTSSCATSASFALTAAFAQSATPFDPSTYLSSSIFYNVISSSTNQWFGTSSYSKKSEVAVSALWTSASAAAWYASSSFYASSSIYASSSVAATTALYASASGFSTGASSSIYASGSHQASSSWFASSSLYSSASAWAPGTINTGSTYPFTASCATSASYALNGGGSGPWLQTGSTYPITASRAITASHLRGKGVLYGGGASDTSLQIYNSGSGGNATYGSLAWNNSQGYKVGLLGHGFEGSDGFGMFALFGDSAVSPYMGEWDVCDRSTPGDSRVAILQANYSYQGFVSYSLEFIVRYDEQFYAPLCILGGVNGATIGQGLTGRVDPPQDGLYVVGNVGIGTPTTTEKLTVDGNISASGTVTCTTLNGNVSGDVTGDLTGTASCATSASWARGFTSGSTHQITASYATSASWARGFTSGSTHQITASWATNVVNGSSFNGTGSLYGTASWATNVVNGSSFNGTSSLYGTASWASDAVSASLASKIYSTFQASTDTYYVPFFMSSSAEHYADVYYNAALSYAPDTQILSSNALQVSWIIATTEITSAAYLATTAGEGYIGTASWATNVVNGSSFNGTSSLYGTASWALTASVALNAGGPVSYTTLVTSSNNWITASLADANQFVAITTGLPYNFTCSNLPAVGITSETSVLLYNTATTTSSLSFPTNWIFLGGAPLSISSSRSAMLSLKAYGTGIIVAGFAIQY